MLAHSAHPRLISAAPEPRRSFRKTATRRGRRRPHYSRYPFNHTLNETLGNGLTTTRTYTNTTGRVQAITTSGAATIQNQSFSFDALGNLSARFDSVAGFIETFGYDNLNRLITATQGATTTTVTYDSIGNITNKSNVGTYTYGAKPHAVTQVTVTLTSYNLPSNITQGANSVNFIYDADHARIKQTTATQTTIYLNPRIDAGLHFEKEVKGGVTENKHYIYGASGVVGVYTTSSAASPKTSYFHQDHLGSIVAVTNDSGSVIARYAFDPWGKRLVLAGDAHATHHGFTGHEHLDEVGLVHMNGRVYDPVLGRFMSADPYIQAPDNLQSYNRYSYVWNNPLSATDPSGYFRWKSIRNIFIRAAAAVADAMGCSGYCSAAVGAYQGYKSGGLTGAIVGGIQGYVGYQMSVNFPLGDGAGNILWGNVARGAAVNGAFGCASASAAGGDCGRGALSGAAGTVGAAYGLPGAIIAGCAAGRIGGGSCSEGALNAVGTYVVYSAVGYIARASVAASIGSRFNEEAPAQGEQERNRQYTIPDNYRSTLTTTFNVDGEVIDRIIITENSDFARQHGENTLAVTRVNAIYLSGSGASFVADPKLTLHEYYHVLRQWNTGELTVLRYIGEWIRQGFNYDKIKYEVQAREFANQNVQRYRSLLEQQK